MKVVDYVIDNDIKDLCCIISDSKSVLECICNINEDTELILNLRNKLQILNIRLFWTRAHVGTLGSIIMPKKQVRKIILITVLQRIESGKNLI